MLSDYMPEKDIAKIANRLQVRLIIADILNGEGALTDDVRMGLHEILSDDQPDSALLSIALSALSIANTHYETAATFQMLKIECERVIAEYGMMWLQNAQAKNLDTNTVFETLVHIPEDLESISELLEFAKITLEFRDPEAAKLCTILTTQAGAQSIIAQTFIDSMDMGDSEPWNIYEGEDIDMGTLIAAENATEPFYTDNVIQFPMARN